MELENHWIKGNQHGLKNDRTIMYGDGVGEVIDNGTFNMQWGDKKLLSTGVKY